MRLLPAILLIILLAAVSIARNDLWSDERTLWGDSISKSPRKSRGYNELGLHQITEGRYREAYALLRRSLELNPFQGQVYINLGMAFEGLGRTDDAVAMYEKAAWMSPADPVPYYNLGVVLYKTRRDPSRALDYFLKARDLDPREPDVHHFLSRIYTEQGDLARANEEDALYRYLKP